MGLASQRVEYLIELVDRSDGQVEKDDFPAAELDGPARHAVEPFVADFVAEPAGQIDRVLQQLYRVHPSFSKSPASVTGSATAE